LLKSILRSFPANVVIFLSKIYFKKACFIDARHLFLRNKFFQFIFIPRKNITILNEFYCHVVTMKGRKAQDSRPKA